MLAKRGIRLPPSSTHIFSQNPEDASASPQPGELQGLRDKYRLTSKVLSKHVQQHKAKAHHSPGPANRPEVVLIYCHVSGHPCQIFPVRRFGLRNKGALLRTRRLPFLCDVRFRSSILLLDDLVDYPCRLCLRVRAGELDCPFSEEDDVVGVRDICGCDSG